MKNSDILAKNISQHRMLPLLVGISLCLIVISLWWYLDNQRKVNLQSIVAKIANEHSSYIEADIRARVPSLQRIALRWKTRGGTPKAEFIQDATAYINDLPGFQALEWVDKNFFVRWIAPLKGNEKAQNLNLAFEKNRRIALESARDKGIPTMTSSINLVQGGKGFLIYIPLFVNKEFNGFVLAVFRIEQWLNYVFNIRSLNKDKNNYRVAVFFDNNTVYTQSGWADDKYSSWLATSNIKIMGQTLSVSLRPTDHFFNSKLTPIPEIIAVSGISLSVLLAFMIFLLQKTNAANVNVRNINITLEESIKKRKRAEDKAKNANQAKSQFLSSMSHEFRTPLNAIMGFSQLIEMDAEDDLIKENVKEIINAGNHLIELINEILDLSKIESGKMDIYVNTQNLNQLLNKCISIINPAANKHLVKIENKVISTSDHTIKVDAKRFKQIMLNLLSNAIKYNRKNGKVTIECSPIDKNILELSVIDTGNGLSPKQISNLFRPFERVGASNSHIEGIGLGLIISKDLIELMGGSIGVESGIGTGSRFWIQIPLQ